MDRTPLKQSGNVFASLFTILCTLTHIIMQREGLTYQFYSLGESPQLVSLTPSAELNVTAHGFDSESR